MRNGIPRYTKGIIAARGWETGTSLENRVALWLSYSWSSREVSQQYTVGRYRLDFAWPLIKVAIEADGFHHKAMSVYIKDLLRDEHLRSLGWIIFRISDTTDEDIFSSQIIKINSIVHLMMNNHELFK